MASKIIFAMLAFSMGWEACSNGQQSAADAPPASSKPSTAGGVSPAYFDKNINMNPPMDTAKIVWEVEIFPKPSRSGTIQRLHDDGSLYSWNNARRVYLDGKPTLESAPYAWRLDAKISDEGLASIKQFIRQGFFELQSNTAVLGHDQGMIQWRTMLDGGHVIRYPSGKTGDAPETVRQITVTLQTSVIPGSVPWEQD